MASKETALTKPLEVEVLPPSQLPSLREDLATMEKLFNDLDPIYREARNLQLVFPETAARIRAGELTAEFKRICKDAEDPIASHKTLINDFKEKYILTPERKVANRGEEIRALLTPKMAEWDRSENAAKEADKKRQAREVQAKLDREAEERRQADEEAAKALRIKRVAEIRADLKNGVYGAPKSAKAKRQAQKLLEEAGATEEAAKAQASAEEEEAKEKSKQVAATVTVKSNVGPVAGNVKRVNYSAKCIDHRLFILGMMMLYEKKDMQGFERLLEVLEVSEQKLSEQARKQIKTHPDDDRHALTPEEFTTLYPFVVLDEKRSY
jgi:hypothetical protein